jgi:transposase
MASRSRGQPYSQDLRDRVLAMDHASSAVVADRFGVSRSYVIKARQRRERLGDVAPGAQRSHTQPKLAGHDDTLRARVAEQSDQTLEELRDWILHTLGISVSVSNLCGRLRRLGLTLKKRMARPVCNGEIGWRVGLHQRIRSQGIDPGQDGFRAFQAS